MTYRRRLPERGSISAAPAWAVYKLLDVGDKRKPYPEIFLGILAVLLFACAVIGASKYGLDDKVAVGVVAAALLLAVLAAFSSQVEGNLRLGKHFEIPIAARRTKQQSQKSKAPEAKTTRRLWTAPTNICGSSPFQTAFRRGPVRGTYG